MQLCIIHLSDIHFDESNYQLILERKDKIISSIQSALSFEKIGCYLVLVSGDIAFRGVQSEYEWAYKFFLTFKQTLNDLVQGDEILFAFVPGNHDCVLTKDIDVREALIEKMISHIDNLENKDGIVRNLLASQDDFFKFVSRIEEENLRNDFTRLYYEKSFNLNEKHILIRCFNSAWLSRLKEKQGDLYYPVQYAASGYKKIADFIISVFHHPYNWFESNNARELKRFVEANSDLVLTGHEHEESTYTKTMFKENGVRYIEGNVLFESGSSKSGFNLYLIDLNQNGHKYFSFDWNGTIYTHSSKPISEFLLNSEITRLGFNNKDEYKELLYNLGVGFSHVKKQKLSLTDFFVYPGLTKYKMAKKSAHMKMTDIRGEDLIEKTENDNFVLVVGDENSGKTSFAKKLYLDFQSSHNKIPLFLCSKKIIKAKITQLMEIIKDTFSEQYDIKKFEDYWQSDRSKKVLIIDNFEPTLFSNNSKDILENLQDKFSKIIVFQNGIMNLSSLFYRNETNILFDNQYFEINEFGYYHRELLIRKWVFLGSYVENSDSALIPEVNQLSQVVTTLLGNDLLPSFPFFILSILQMWDLNKVNSPSLGTYGPLYEALITMALHRANSNPTQIEIKYAFLSRVAYYMFLEEKNFLELDELEIVRKQYHEQYEIEISDKIIVELDQSKLFANQSQGYTFPFRYCFSYFLAKFYAENVQSDSEYYPGYFMRLAGPGFFILGTPG